MLENYSISDLFANLYKKKILNIILCLILFFLMAVPILLKTLGGQTQVVDSTNFSSNLIYKIESPLEEQQSFNKNRIGGYGDFYTKLIESNLNGAFLFNDLSSENMKKIASELEVGEITLKNSNMDYWEKKIIVNGLVNNAGVSVKILTSSKDANILIEKKLDSLVDEYSKVYSEVKIEKLKTVYSEENGTNTKNVGVNKVKLILKLIIVAILAVIVTIITNVVVYIFNPTMNREEDYIKYNIGRVYNIDNFKELSIILNHVYSKSEKVVITSSNDKILNKFKTDSKGVFNENFTVKSCNNIENILNDKIIIFVEEYGVTRYRGFGEILRKMKMLEKSVDGVISYRL